VLPRQVIFAPRKSHKVSVYCEPPCPIDCDRMDAIFDCARRAIAPAELCSQDAAIGQPTCARRHAKFAHATAFFDGLQLSTPARSRPVGWPILPRQEFSNFPCCSLAKSSATLLLPRGPRVVKYGPVSRSRVYGTYASQAYLQAAESLAELVFFATRNPEPTPDFIRMVTTQAAQVLHLRATVRPRVVGNGPTNRTELINRSLAQIPHHTFLFLLTLSHSFLRSKNLGGNDLRLGLTPGAKGARPPAYSGSFTAVWSSLPRERLRTPGRKSGLTRLGQDLWLKPPHRLGTNR